MSFKSSRGNDDSASSFGVSNYEEKVANSEKLQEVDIGFEDVAEIGNYFRDLVLKDLPKTAMNTFKVVKSGLTPSFINRMNQKKIHMKYVEDTEK